jgi:phosphoribosylformylglycinamidine (FGAM) synthase-like amidotransferase family enzyme
MKFGVIVFPGSNCDHDAWYAITHNLGQQAEFIWHDSPSLGSVDAVILPGGFFLWRLSALRRDRQVLAGDGGREEGSPKDGGLVLGICNGFQILVESRPSARRAGTEAASRTKPKSASSP